MIYAHITFEGDFVVPIMDGRVLFRNVIVLGKTENPIEHHEQLDCYLLEADASYRIN